MYKAVKQIYTIPCRHLTSKCPTLAHRCLKDDVLNPVMVTDTLTTRPATHQEWFALSPLTSALHAALSHRQPVGGGRNLVYEGFLMVIKGFVKAFFMVIELEVATHDFSFGSS